MPDRIRGYFISILICTLFIFALLLFAAAAQAQQVFTDPDNPNTVIRIEDLLVNFDVDGGSNGEEVYNVDFRFESAFSVYGQALDGPQVSEQSITYAGRENN